MTANEIFQKSLRLSGLSLTEFSAYSSLTSVCADCVNPVYAELYYLSGKTDFTPLENDTESVVLDEKLIHDCLIYGVCAQLMYMFGAKEDYLVFRELYETKRNKAFRSSKISVIKDTFARGCDA